MGKVKRCVLDPGRGCVNSGGCPRILGLEVLPLSEEYKKARASWCDYKVSIYYLEGRQKPQESPREAEKENKG